MQKKWNVMPDTAEESRCLAAEAGVSEVVAALLLHRGIQTAAEADLFLHPPQQQFYDPFLLKDMDKAVERICLALDAGEKIVVYGDYDVDGITSTTLLMRMLQRLGANVVEAAAIIDLPELGGSTTLKETGLPIYTVCSF